jgi:hypothetical protein
VSSKGEILRTFSLRWGVLPIIALCTSTWWASPNALAQETAPGVMRLTALPTSWSLDGLWTSTAHPHLVIVRLERGDTPSHNSLQRLPLEDAGELSATNATSRPIGPAGSGNRADKDAPGPLVLSSLLSLTAGVRGLNSEKGPRPRCLREVVL